MKYTFGLKTIHSGNGRSPDLYLCSNIYFCCKLRYNYFSSFIKGLMDRDLNGVPGEDFNNPGAQVCI
jgi:hypothetical protein